MNINNSNETLVLNLDDPASTLELVGGKGSSLARLAAADLPVPPGFHITTHAYHRFIDENHLTEEILSLARLVQPDDAFTLDSASAQIQAVILNGEIPATVAELICRKYDELGKDDPPIAVRSSATAEDLPEMSFAGQQETYLNIRGADKVLEAVRRCWASLWIARAIAYRIRNNILPEDVALAVVVQQLIQAEVSGILFTANPVTGERDKMLINAAWGLGEAIVSGNVTPDTFIVNKQTGLLELQEIADKEIMTVCSSEGTRQEPVPGDNRGQSTLSPKQVIELSQLGMQIERLYERPMDIEWALQDQRFFILQARPITALPEPRPTLDWKLPHLKGNYLRQNVIELLPDPLSPLFATLGLSAWNQAMHHLGKSIGLKLPDFMPEQALLTINDYAYLNLAFTGAQSVRYLLAMPSLVRGFSTAQKRWEEEARPRYAAVVDKWTMHDFNRISATQLLEGTREIVQAAAEHYLTIQSGILPRSKISETLFPLVYNHLIKRQEDPPALTFLLGFDSEPIRT